jgi:hypothetical protein
MIISQYVDVPQHSSNKKILEEAGFVAVDRKFNIPVETVLKLFPNSNVLKVSYNCDMCHHIFYLSVTDWTRKIHKEYCGVCLKTHVLIGSNHQSFGHHYNAGISKSQQHREKLRGNRPSMRGEKNPNWKNNTPVFKRYKNKVHQLSHKVYLENIDIINPIRLPRTRAGVIDGHQLDHIKSIKKCFEEGLTPEEASVVTNLQILPWKENLKKSTN